MSSRACGAGSHSGCSRTASTTACGPKAPAELDLAEDFARTVDVPFGRTGVALGAGGNLQARARTLRWEALEAAAARARSRPIATGHHADDRAETMLMRILRGTRAPRPGGAPARDGHPDPAPATRATGRHRQRHIRRHRIPHCTYPSNQNSRFLRVRVRLELLPVLERLNPRVVEHMYARPDELGGLSGLAASSRLRREDREADRN